jgi:hypothetical protein
MLALLVRRRRAIAPLMLFALLLFVVPAVMAAPLRRFLFQDTPPPWSQEVLAALYATLLSAALVYIPGLRVKWAALDEDRKKFIMLIGLFVISVGVLAASCFSVLGLVIVECSQAGALKVITVFVAVITASQSTHRILPEPADVKAVKATKTSQTRPLGR